MQSFILAGGFATRLWPLTEKRAKPLLPLAGKPLLTHLVEKVPADMNITVSTNGLFGDDMRNWAKTLDRKNIDILIEDAGHDDHKLGALGAIAAWINQNNIDDDILLIAGDNFISFDLQKFCRHYRGNPLLAAYDIKDLELARSFGTVILNDATASVDRTIKAFEEKPKNPQSTWVSTGCYILPKNTFPTLLAFAKEHPDNIGGIFEEYLRKGLTVDCFLFSELWSDIGSFDSYLATHKAVVGTKHVIHPDTKIDADSQLKGSIAIGPKTTVRNSTLTDCIVFGNTTIDNCVLEDCIIDEDCHLEGVDLSRKMLSRETVLQERRM